jgi:tetraacyldisaccharide 4'-kinase
VIRLDNILLVILLYPFSLIYGFMVSVRNILFDYHVLSSREFSIPLISVGNITVGGTGKTPHIEYLVRLLRTEFRVATLSRGYSRKSQGFQIATETSTVEQVGDEPLQIKKKFPDITVAVDQKRANGIERLMADDGDLDVILLDDAFQHRYVKPGLSILLVDYNRPLSGDRLLPAGRLREQAFEKKRAHIILVTRCPEHLKPIERRLVVKELSLYPFQHLFFTTMNYEDPRPVFPEAVPDPLSQDRFRDLKPGLLMLTGIANPRWFKKHLRGISTRIEELIYPDHHYYSPKDIDLICMKFFSMDAGEKFLFTTEKDAVRLRKYADLDPAVKERAYYVPMYIDFLNDDTRNFNQFVLNYVRNNRRNSILHKKQD